MDNMARIEGTKKYCLEKRAELIILLKKQGYNGADIGIVFNIDRSVVNRIISTHYKIIKNKII